ncbi:hypothetical protein AGMMS49982_01850 [Bacteroidia bacterium]|nr:hypothetical protein AGMMS49982_01850 [Bacteroidia bacterium]
MKTIIAVQGSGGIGKTPAVRAVFNMMNIKGNFTILIDDYDIKATGTYLSKEIGIESQGDPNFRQGESLKDFAVAGCDIIVCACRTKGETVDNIKRIARGHSYKIIWTSTYFSTSAKRTHGIMPNGADLNDAFAKAIVDLIGKL